MSRPRTATNILKLRGAAKKHPERLKERENEPVNVNPIGDAPEFLSSEEIKAWDLIVSTCIPGVLGEADKTAVAMASQMLAKCIAGEGSNQDKSLLKGYLGQFGMLPGDRSKISLPQKKPKNRFEDD